MICYLINEFYLTCERLMRIIILRMKGCSLLSKREDKRYILHEAKNFTSST